MIDKLHLGLAIFVFVMMLIGLILTVVEFRRVMRESGDLRSEHRTGGSDDANGPKG